MPLLNNHALTPNSTAKTTTTPQITSGRPEYNAMILRVVNTCRKERYRSHAPHKHHQRSDVQTNDGHAPLVSDEALAPETRLSFTGAQLVIGSAYRWNGDN